MISLLEIQYIREHAVNVFYYGSSGIFSREQQCDSKGVIILTELPNISHYLIA